MRSSAALLISGETSQHCPCCGFPTPARQPAWSQVFPGISQPAPSKSLTKETPFSEAHLPALAGDGVFAIAPVVLQHLHGAAQPPSQANPSDKQGKFKETPWLGPQQHQRCSFTLQKAGHGISRVLPSPKAAFVFPCFLLTWSNASSVKQVSLAHEGCTGKCFKGEQRKSRS